MEDLLQLCKEYPMIKAILINCCSFDKMRDYYNNVIKRVLAAHPSLLWFLFKSYR